MGNPPNRGKTILVGAWSEDEARAKAERDGAYVESVREERPGVWRLRVTRPYQARRR